MKKWIMIFGIALLSSQVASAQTWDEWFKQRKTQRKYLAQQIAALQVYLGYLKKGYDIARDGLTLVGKIKDGDFNLHRDFLGSLKAVNPRIRNFSKVADIVALQVRITKTVNNAIHGVREAGQFTNVELEYCQGVFDQLLTDCFQTLELLLQLITAGEMEMSDDQRLKRIEELHQDMQDKYGFAASYSEEMGLLAVQRMQEQYEVELSRKLRGLH